ncbi:Inactive poly ADP-ribose polymerase [Nymphaea thermarum]|nr:Inactive poly ADP-ribose polymerase [Nymphaea thermarum]
MDRAVGELDRGRNRVTDLKRKRAVKCAAFLMSERCGKIKRAGTRRGLRFPPAEGFSHGCGCCSGKSMINNYANFRKSGLPKRIMFFSKGEWCDFPAHLREPLVDAFGGNRSAVEVALDARTCLVDFLHMLLIDLSSGLQQSIAWIDESDRCFFPKFFFDDNDARDEEKCRHPMSANAPEIEVKLEIDISAADSSKTEDQSDVSISHAKIENVQRSPLRDEHSDLDQNSGSDRNQPAEIKEVVGENGDLLREGGSLGRGLSSMSQGVLETFGSESLRDKIVALDRGSSDYTAVRDVFLLGLGTLVTASHIVGIYRYSSTSSSAQAQMQLFENQVHVMKSYRGDANVRYAWHGSSRDGIVEIMLHGFGRIQNPIGGMAYGSGVYLSSKECALISASFSDVDEKGLQHMVLCRVIMGNMEQVPLGSAQFCPSSDNFDSGVDDIRNPRRYVIWGTHMNTHIHPEYVVSFKVPPVEGKLNCACEEANIYVDAISAIVCCN